MKSIRSGESGYVLLAVMLAVTLILVALSIELPRIAQQIKREKEEELVHRGKDYATAVKRFVHKNGGRYPLSVEQLEDTNHIRFLRKRYKDPITGESDWKMVHVGEAQVNIPAPNPGLSGGGGQNPGLFNSGSGGQSGIGGSSGGGSSGASGGSGGVGGGSGGVGGGSGGVSGGSGSISGGSGSTGQMGTITTSPIGNGQTVGGGQIMGVASTSKKQSIKEFNDKDHYDEWYFVYDLRLEQSGGTGVTVASPRIGASTTGGDAAAGSGASGTSPAGASFGQPQPTPTPTPPPQVPN